MGCVFTCLLYSGGGTSPEVWDPMTRGFLASGSSCKNPRKDCSGLVLQPTTSSDWTCQAHPNHLHRSPGASLLSKSARRFRRLKAYCKSKIPYMGEAFQSQSLLAPMDLGGPFGERCKGFSQRPGCVPPPRYTKARGTTPTMVG